MTDRDRDVRRPPGDKDESDRGPDQPTPSDDATLQERSEGAHAEYSVAPSALHEEPVDDEADEGEDDRP